MYARKTIGCLAVAAVLLGLGAGAQAQQFKDPFRFRVHNNPAALNMAFALRQIQQSGSSGSSSTSSTTGGGSSTGSGAVTIYTSSTVGNLTEITTILEQGAEGWVNLDTSQDGSNSSQSASAQGTQVFGGANNLGPDGTATNNVEVVTEGETSSSGGEEE